MLPGETLGISAQIAVTLAGFTGIVVAFATGAVREWPPADQFRLRLLLATSVVPLALSLTGLMLLATDMRARLVWELSSGMAALLLIASGVSITHSFRRVAMGEFEQAGGNIVIFYIASATGIGITLLQFVNVIVLQTFWPFFVCVIVSMLICVVQFMRPVLHHPGAK